jgi:hypothetical protein
VETAFYSVADSAAFVGVAGLLNSLRLAGHDEPFFLLDCGLTAEQRAVLEPHATLVASGSDVPATAAKAIAPLQAPAETMVLLDADVIVTRHLGELVARCAAGKIVVFPDDTPGRFFAEWAGLGLGTPVRRPYISGGHLLVPFDWRVALLERLSELAATIDPGRTFVDGGSPADPLYYLDQDVLNTMLATVIPPEAVDRAEEGLVAYAPFDGVSCDPQTLECRDAQGRRPCLLHHILRKPWSAALPESVYSTLLRRVLNAPDVPVQVPPRLLPLRLRSGPLAALDRRRAALQSFAHDRARGRLGIRPRVDQLLAKDAG